MEHVIGLMPLFLYMFSYILLRRDKRSLVRYHKKLLIDQV